MQAEQAQLQAEVDDLKSQLSTVSATVSQQGSQIEPIKSKLDKTLQDTTAQLQTIQTTTEKKYSEVKDATSLSINISWTLITGYMVMFMQAGFAMVECGFSRIKNVGHTAMLNFMIYSLGMLGYWVLRIRLPVRRNGRSQFGQYRGLTRAERSFRSQFGDWFHRGGTLLRNSRQLGLPPPGKRL